MEEERTISSLSPVARMASPFLVLKKTARTATTMTHKIKRKLGTPSRAEILERLQKLKAEMTDMENSIKQDVENKNLTDRDIFRINEKVKDLEKQILNVIEG